MTDPPVYTDGRKVLLGDVVSDGTVEGTVVCVVGRNEFTPRYPKRDWAYLRVGALILFPHGLVHYAAMTAELSLVSRGKQ